MIERGLVIRSPWIDKILAGEKTWEIRDKPTNKSEPIALIRGGSGTIVGCCTLNKSKGPLSAEVFEESFDKHRVTPQQLAEFYGDKPVYAWLLSDVRKLPKPIPYHHPSGAVQFVLLSPKNVPQFDLLRDC